MAEASSRVIYSTLHPLVPQSIFEDIPPFRFVFVVTIRPV